MIFNNFTVNSVCRNSLMILILCLVTTLVARGDQEVKYLEDEEYEVRFGNPEAKPMTPQSARKQFGEPPEWMIWNYFAQYPACDGAYSGIEGQDPQRNYVFWGGGQSGRERYVGPITFICDDGKIPRLDDPKPTVSAGGLRVGSLQGAYIEIQTDSGAISCYTWMSDWRDRVEYSNAPFNTDYVANIERKRSKLLEDARRLGGTPLVVGDVFERQMVFFLEEVRENAEYRFKIIDLADGFPLGTFSHERVFVVPDEVKPYFSGLSTDDVSFITEYVSSDKLPAYLILRDGNYLIQRGGVLRTDQNL